jgi:uncharacterized protein HemX
MNAPSASLLSWAALALALIATVGVGLEAFHRQQALSQQSAESGAHGAAAASEMKALKARQSALEADLKRAEGRAAEFEARLAEREGDRAAVSDMLRDLNRNAEDRVYSEAEQLLTLAQQQLLLAGDVQSAIIALQSADQRLARAERATLPLRKVLARDLERLRAAPVVDVAGIASRLDALIAGSHDLPLALSEPAPAVASRPASDPPESGLAGRLLRSLASDLAQLVRIRDVDANEGTLLSPAAAQLVREQLKVRLLTARLGLLARDETTYRGDLKAAERLLTRFFDSRAGAVRAARETLKPLQAANIAVTPPDINQSLAAIREARIARDRVGR